MSFTATVKDEVSKLDVSETEKISELSAIVQNNDYSDSIKVVTENNSVARLIYSLFKDLFNVYPKVSVRRGYNYSKNMLYTLEVKSKVSDILKSLGIDGDVPESFIYADEDLLMAYLKGLFLTKASVNDPKTSRYHLEFNLDNLEYAQFVQKSLNYFHLNSKILHREHRYVVYIKEGSQIVDILNVMEAPVALMELENIRILKEMRNSVNRQVNCETANINKTVSAAVKQIEDIRYIEEKAGLKSLPANLQEMARVRLENPDGTLKELGEALDPPVGKSGVNHRLRKLSLLAEELRSGSGSH